MLMPWESVNGTVRFSGRLADLMAIVMTAYDQDTASGALDVVPGTYVTACASVLREVVIESLEADLGTPDPEAIAYLARVSDAVHEDADGTVHIEIFAVLDDIAEHTNTAALEAWLGSPAVRDAIRAVATSSPPPGR
jgi:hypothetical protein